MPEEIKKLKQYGFIPPVVVPEDYWFGSKKLGSQIINPSGNWLKYLPVFEHQRRNFESNACVSFGILSSLEILHNLLWEVDPNYSDRFTAKISGTDPNAGNTPKNVSEAIRNNGTVPEYDWPFAEPLEEYYKEIPQRIKDIGKEWTKNYGFGYEWVDKDDLKEALKRSPVGCAVSAWVQNSKGEYIKFADWNHWVVLVAYDEQDRPIIWDSYGEGLKTLEKDYNFGFPQIYRLFGKEPEVEKSWWQKLKRAIKELLKDIQEIFNL